MFAGAVYPHPVSFVGFSAIGSFYSKELVRVAIVRERRGQQLAGVGRLACFSRTQGHFFSHLRTRAKGRSVLYSRGPK